MISTKVPSQTRQVHTDTVNPLKAMPKVAIHTHGCKLNQADSESMARAFVEAGYEVVDASAKSDVVVVNTCTVTSTADSKARQALRRLGRKNPGALIVATGCYAQRDRERLAQTDGVSLVVENTRKEQLVSLVGESLRARKASSQQIFPMSSIKTLDQRQTRTSGPVARFLARRRSMLKIQEGCNQVCSYCIVPKVRGRERSIPTEYLVEEITRRVAEGCREVVLTGTQLGSYGFDIPGADLHGLLRSILAKTSLPRLRVSSLQAQEISDELLALWSDSRLCPHFHIPLQSGSDDTLPAMRRRYDTETFAGKVELVRHTLPGAGVTTDIIVGFPGESDEIFAASLSFAKSMNFSDMHVFPYSSRPGTSAAHLTGQVKPEVKRERMSEMLLAARGGFEAFRREQTGAVRPVLWETVRRQTGGAVWSGLTDNYIRVRGESGLDLAGIIGDVRLGELDDSGEGSVSAEVL